MVISMPDLRRCVQSLTISVCLHAISQHYFFAALILISSEIYCTHTYIAHICIYKVYSYIIYAESLIGLQDPKKFRTTGSLTFLIRTAMQATSLYVLDRDGITLSAAQGLHRDYPILVESVQLK